MSKSSPEGIELGKGSKLISAEIKLEPNEVLVKNFKIIEGCIGTKKTNTRLMLTFTKEQKDFEFVDVFLTTEQAIVLRDDLEYYLHGEYIKR